MNFSKYYFGIYTKLLIIKIWGRFVHLQLTISVFYLKENSIYLISFLCPKTKLNEIRILILRHLCNKRFYELENLHIVWQYLVTSKGSLRNLLWCAKNEGFKKRGRKKGKRMPFCKKKWDIWALPPLRDY